MLLTPILERAHPIAKVPSIGDRLEPRGMTQLCDAIALRLALRCAHDAVTLLRSR